MVDTFTANEVVTAAKLNSAIEYRWTYHSQYGLASPGAGAKTASLTVGYIEVPSVTYPSQVTVHANCGGTMAASGDWEIMLGRDTAADPTDSSTTQPAFVMEQCYLHNNGATDRKMSAPMSATFEAAAGTTYWIRVFAKRTAGTFTLADVTGLTLFVARLEVYP